MAAPAKLSGETIIVHHIPLVHCQVPGRQCCGPVKHPNPFCPPDNLGLTRTTSLPERDILHQEPVVYSSLIQTSSSSGSSAASEECDGGGGRKSCLRRSSSAFPSSSSEERAPPPAPSGPRYKSNPLRHNPFLVNAEEDEEDDGNEDEDGGSLNGYLEDSSFHLHGNPSDTHGKVTGLSYLHELEYHSEALRLHGGLGETWLIDSDHMGEEQQGDKFRGIHSAVHLEDLERLRHESSSSPLSMDCGEQDWAEDEEEDEDHHMSNGQSSQACSCCSSPDTGHHPSRCCHCELSETLSEGQLGYVSDSSYNSFDGMLVSYSAIYKTGDATPAKPLNLNASMGQSCTSSNSEPGGAFYLDLHTSPTEPPCGGDASLQDSDKNTSYCCQASQAVDANCNAYPHHCEDLLSCDMTSCVQSRARLVVAAQNYYKLVTCDLSSQSSPSPAGSSATSCSEENNQGSPNQPTEYFLFRRPEGAVESDEEEGEEKKVPHEGCQEEEESEKRKREQDSDSTPVTVLEGQVYVNISPPAGSQGQSVPDLTGRPRSRSYDRILDVSPSLERMLSCPMRLSEASPLRAPPPRVTSFAEIARSKRRGVATCAEASPASSLSSIELPPVLEQALPGKVPGGQRHPLMRCHSQGSCDVPPHLRGGSSPSGCPAGDHSEVRSKAEGGLSSSSETLSSVVRYSKDRRPTTLPIQPFTFQHQLGKSHSQLLRPLLSEYVSQMQSRGSGKAANQGADEHKEETPKRQIAAPGSVRPSPLGSYSPVRQQQGAPSSETCSTCSPSPESGQGVRRAPRSLSCPGAAGPQAQWSSPWCLPKPSQAEGNAFTQGHSPAPPAPTLKKDSLPGQHPTATGSCSHHTSPPKASDVNCTLPRLPRMHHLSPQALKWREYRRRNPLGIEKDSEPLSGCLTARRAESRLARPNVFNFPASSAHVYSQLNGQPLKLQHPHHSDLLPDVSLAERPPEEFCLSPDAASESMSIDLLQKRELVKAVNMAVDLIVAHFGTSRDPGVKAKLGNSSVSPNIGHLILKYLCPAIRDVLQDGLRGYILDLIVGQRRNLPWSVVEASTQLGPSTRVIHSLFSKVSQYSELTSHSMRLNAFIFGLLNLRSLEFWFNHLFTHEDIVTMHYHPWGFLALSQGMCQLLFEELLLLLQPLSLLPFDLDLLFEPHLLQKGQEHMRRKEQLCSAGAGLEQSMRSTFQLMRGWSKAGLEVRKDGVESVAEEVAREKHRNEPNRASHRQTSQDGMEHQRGRTVEVHHEGTGSKLKWVEPEMKKPMLNRDWRSVDTGGNLLDKRYGDVRVEGGKEVQRGTREEGEKVRRTKGEPQSMDTARQRDRQAGWWYQLMQSSQVYIDNSTEGSKFVKWEKRKKAGGAGEVEAGRRWSQPPPRVGVVEGAEASPAEELLEEAASKSSSQNSDSGSQGNSRPSWMGTPPESRLNELRISKNKETEPEPVTQGAPAGAQEGGAIRWGRLFGAGTGNYVRTEKDEQGHSRSQKTRLPSGWLSLDRAMLDFMAQTVGVGRRLEPLPATQNHALPTPQQPESQGTTQSMSREVRALCHHIATEPGHLSFNKGDLLRVLSRAEPDWLHCSLGNSTGLVPIIYVSLIDDTRGTC